MNECVGPGADHGYSRFTCKRCSSIMKEAVQLQCGCRMCKKCAEEEVGSARVFKCRYCDELMNTSDESKLYFKDTRFQREIRSAAMNLSGNKPATQDSSEVVSKSFCSTRQLPSDRRDMHYEDEGGDHKPTRMLGLSKEDVASKDGDIIHKEKTATCGPGKSFREMISKPVAKIRHIQPDIKPLSAPAASKTSVHEGATHASLFPQPSVLVLCGECDRRVEVTKVGEHRKMCRKLHLYNGKSFQVLQELSLVAGMQNISSSATNRQSTRAPRRTLDIARENNILDDIAEELIKPFQDADTVLGQLMRKFKDNQSQKIRTYLQQRLFLETSIDDPIYQTMKWKVENVSRRINENRSLLSRVFCSSLGGYNLRLRIDFQVGSRFWLHVVLVQGENDSHLMWPFQPIVALSILGGTAMDVVQILNVAPVSRCGSEGHGKILLSLQSPCDLSLFLIDNCLFVRCKISQP